MGNINDTYFDGHYKEIWKTIIPAELTGKEIDFIIENECSLDAIEVKSGTTINSSFFEGLTYWHALNIQQNPAYKGTNYLVYGGNVGQLRQNVQVVPWNEISKL